MMKSLFLYLFIGLLIAGCSKTSNSGVCNFNDNNTVAPASEVQAIQNYLNTNNLTATQAPSGFFYKIITQGTGAAVVNLCSNVTVDYVGKFTNGNTFDQNSATFQLGSVIVGWQKGVPLISKGGKIRLYVPPSLGYGPNNYGTIPGNSILIFDITLNDVF